MWTDLISRSKTARSVSVLNPTQLLEAADVGPLKLKKLVSASPAIACRILVSLAQKRMGKEDPIWPRLEKIATYVDLVLNSNFLKEEVVFYKMISGKKEDDYKRGMNFFNEAKHYAIEGDMKNAIRFLLKSRRLFAQSEQNICPSFVITY